MIRKKYQFCLNTSKNCFLCCQEIQFSDQNSENPEIGRKISLENIFRYLKINICELPSFSKKSSSILSQTDIRACFCPSCEIIFKNFTSSYNDLIVCKMKVDSILQDILLKTSKELYSTHGHEQALKRFKIVKEIRESVFNRCKFKLSKSQPRIYLQRRWPKVQKKSPQSSNFEQNLNQDCKVEGNHEILSNASVPFVDSSADEGNCDFVSVKQEVKDDAVDDFEVSWDEAFAKDSLATVSANFKSYSKTKSTEKPFKCNKCPRSFQKSIHLVKHLAFHKTRTQLKCPHCEMAYFRNDFLRGHLLQNHFARLSQKELKELEEFKCKLCSKYFRDRFELAKHARTHAGKEKYNCPHCEQSFFRKRPLKMHIKLVHRKVKKETPRVTKLNKISFQAPKNKNPVKERSVEKISLKCAHCGVVCTRGCKLRGHLLKNHFENLSQEELNYLGEVRCKYCLKYCLDKANLARHVRTHTRENPFECRHCPEKFSSREFLTCHVMNAHKNVQNDKLASSVAHPDIKQEPDEALSSNKKDTSVRKCPHCDKAFPNKLYFFNHLRNTHLDLLNEKDLQKLNPYKCTQCSRTFPNKTKYSAHVRSHTGEKPFKCSYCSCGFIRKDNLVRHLKTHEVKQKECKICKEKFPTEAKLLSHSLVHPEVEKFQCQECQKLFLSSQSLQGHMQVHSGHRKQCKICLKVFANSTERDEHLQEEHKELERNSTRKTKKIYNCSICNEKQFRLRNFEAHMRKHTGERLICEHCPASFIHPDKLKKHLRKHLPLDQQFVCSICKMLFASDERLQKHKGTHGETGRPECNLCGKTFASKMNLFSHQKEVHSGKKPHQCDICGKGFSRVQHLRGHQKVHSEDQ